MESAFYFTVSIILLIGVCTSSSLKMEELLFTNQEDTPSIEASTDVLHNFHELDMNLSEKQESIGILGLMVEMGTEVVKDSKTCAAIQTIVDCLPLVRKTDSVYLGPNIPGSIIVRNSKCISCCTSLPFGSSVCSLLGTVIDTVAPPPPSGTTVPPAPSGHKMASQIL